MGKRRLSTCSHRSCTISAPSGTSKTIHPVMLKSCGQIRRAPQERKVWAERGRRGVQLDAPLVGVYWQAPSRAPCPQASRTPHRCSGRAVPSGCSRLSHAPQRSDAQAERWPDAVVPKVQVLVDETIDHLQVSNVHGQTPAGQCHIGERIFTTTGGPSAWQPAP